MSIKQKLQLKLTRGTISANELRTLLKKSNWMLDRVRGSHEVWVNGSQTFILVTHGKLLKRYQIKQAQEILLGA